MEIIKLKIEGSFEIRSRPFKDFRGQFLNLYRYRENEYEQIWGDRKIAQINLCRTKDIGTVRGLHLQKDPHSEAKLIRCLRGKVWDVCVDMRPESSTYCCWDAVVLSPDKANGILIPEGCAHGYQVLEEHSELLYMHSGDWIKDAESGVRFDDCKLGIKWPVQPRGISERDMNLPVLE